MSEKWSKATGKGWQHKIDTPYQHWWLDKEKINIEGGDKVSDWFQEVFAPTILPIKPNRRKRPRLFMPVEMVNPDHQKLPERWDVNQIRDDLASFERLDEKTVIFGIVDAGIALGHRRFRRPDGRTRFLAAWQQAAKFDGLSSLPFGQELYDYQINDLMRRHSGGDLKDDLDEESFNREARLVTPEHLRGQRELDYRIAHGTHVLDLAAGFDPKAEWDEKLAGRRIIAVNLPPRSVHGTAGNFLAFFARLAVERILFLADALWTVQQPGKAGGFPVVINFSFGLLAGPKDGSSPFELELRTLIHERNRRRCVPTRIVMPAGNSNLSRGNARKLIGSCGTARLRNGTEIPVDPFLRVPWRIFPSDHTSNFVEIWAKARNRETGESADETPAKRLGLWVTPPGAKKERKVPKLRPGQYSSLSDYARVYCYKPRGQKRAHFVICVAPTIRYDPEKLEAPAGLWKITLRYPRENVTDTTVQEVTFTVQSDQSIVPHAVIGRQSYFDDCRYLTHSENGELRDSYGPGKDSGTSGSHLEPWDKFGPVQRKGTQNALATWDHVIVIGGYRDSDLRPSIHSATFDGNSRRMAGREVPSVLYPVDDGPAHFGLLAAGSRDGSVVALRGTSMASALAARDIAYELEKWLRDPEGKHTADEGWLRKRADRFRNANPNMKRHNPLKQGGGLVHGPDLGRDPFVDRLSCRWHHSEPSVDDGEE